MIVVARPHINEPATPPGLLASAARKPMDTHILLSYRPTREHCALKIRQQAVTEHQEARYEILALTIMWVIAFVITTKWQWQWHSKKSVQQSLEAWPWGVSVGVITREKESVRTGAACSVGKVCTCTRLNDCVQNIGSRWESTGVAVKWILWINSPSVESSDSVQHNEGNQETKETGGTRTNKRAPKEDRQVSELISPSCRFPPYIV